MHPRSRASRRRDTEHRLTHDIDVWVAGASADSTPQLVCLLFDSSETNDPNLYIDASDDPMCRSDLWLQPVTARRRRSRHLRFRTVPTEWAVRREPCPKCGQGVASVTHQVRLNGWGGVVIDTPVSATGCHTEGCEWYDARTDNARRS